MRQDDIYTKHPSLVHTDMSRIHTYRVLDIDGNLTEQWERDDTGRFVDVTAREQAKIEVARAAEALEQLRRAERKAACAKEATDDDTHA